MPRKTKEPEEKVIETTKKSTKKATKKTTTKPAKSTKKATASSGTTKKTTSSKTKKNTEVAKTTTKKTSTVKKASDKTSLSKKTASKTTKKSTTTKVAKTTSKKTTTKKQKATPISIIEYYDLPYRYSQTIVKILAQTPNMLFVYWDISDEDRNAYIQHYGDDFFSKTKPVLIIHNETMNYSFEIEINDFANSWYLHVNDANCKYNIELGRRPYHHISNIQDDYIYVSSSNKLDAPNDHILFEKFNPSVTYKNTKTGNTVQKDFSTLTNYKNMKKIYNIYDLYKEIYKNDLFNEIQTRDLTNPSSSMK